MDALHAGSPSKGKLMVVESGTKAKEIKAFLPSNWIILPSNGFVKEIIQPKSVPAARKDEYGRYGIRLSDFDPMLSFVPRGQTTLSAIRRALAANVDTLVISTDPDRAGDSIGAQLLAALKSDVSKYGITVYRASWHEITRKAVLDGLAHAKDVKAMVPGASADMARAVYDRLFGYSVSPYLWKTVASGTSGGRAQSPALRLVVDRERARMAFVAADYYGIDGVFSTGPERYHASLVSIDGAKVATGSSFDSDGKAKPGVLVLGEKDAKAHARTMKSARWHVSDVSDRAYRRTPPRPYKTSTFQQDVGTRLGMSSKGIMRVAQKLFENAVITYLRTDAEVMSQEGVDAARKLAKKLYGAKAVPSSPRTYKTRGNAQEGHEAIRPVVDEKTGLFPAPSSIRARLDAIDSNAYAVYDLIWRRSVATQMNDAVGRTITVSLEDDKGVYLMTSVGTTLSDPGWTLAMSDGGTSTPPPNVSRGDAAKALEMKPMAHATKPPARFTEPQLVAKLEELGIGRPATYSQIVSVNQDRGYIAKRGKALFPTWRGMQVASILEHKLGSFVDYGYTSAMETDLDAIESGALSYHDFLSRAWSDVDSKVNGLAAGIDWNEINGLSTVGLDAPYVVRCNRSGAWLEDTSQAADKDGRRRGCKMEGDELYDGMDAARCAELMSHVSSEEPRDIGALKSGAYAGFSVKLMKGRYGAYAHAVDAKGRNPVNITLPEGVDFETATMAEVAPLFEQVKLPRQLGDGYFVGIGKRGPWIGYSNGRTRRARAKFVSMPDGMDPRTVSLDDARRAFDAAAAATPERKRTGGSKTKSSKSSAPRGRGAGGARGKSGRGPKSR